MRIMRNQERVFVASACRTPIGRAAGSLSNISDTELMAYAYKEAMRRLGQELVIPDGAYAGCCFPQESNNLARKALISASISMNVPAATINRTCCSSMEAVIQGARQIAVGDADVMLVGGVENMSRSPNVMKNVIKNMRAKTRKGLPALDDSDENLMDEVGICAEFAAREYKISRERQDETALKSWQKAHRSYLENSFDQEIFPLHLKIASAETVVQQDELIAKVVTREDLCAEEAILVRDGTITKLNASQINDGAAAMVLVSESYMKEHGIQPLAEYISSETVGVHYKDFALGPVIAINKMLEKNVMKLGDVDLIECNEAYALQYIICGDLLKWDENKVNIKGGSIALGHPLGCTGLRIITTLIYSLLSEKKEFGIAAMCGGGGLGQSIMFKNVM